MKDELPNQIYLQYYDENGEDLLNPARNEVTWCIDRINESDAVYTLATPELPALLERLATHVPYTLHTGIGIATQARALAASIREALALEANDDN